MKCKCDVYFIAIKMNKRGRNWPIDTKQCPFIKTKSLQCLLSGKSLQNDLKDFLQKYFSQEFGIFSRSGRKLIWKAKEKNFLCLEHKQANTKFLHFQNKFHTFLQKC